MSFLQANAGTKHHKTASVIASMKKLTLGVLVLLFSLNLQASASTPVELAERLLNEFLKIHPRTNSTVQQFAETLVLPNIHLEQMAIGLCGRSQWSSWSPEERAALVKALRGTLVRYVQEASESYSNQQLRVIKDEQLSPTERTVRVLVKTDYLPDVDIDLFVRRDASGQWFAHDFAVAGISYVKMKRAQYKTVLTMGGLPALLDHLNQKNAAYGMETKLGNL